MKKSIIGTRILDSGMELEYYITKKQTGRNESVYGLEIIMRCDNRTEKECAYGISFDKKLVSKIGGFLMKNRVTPIAMLHIIDERITIYENELQGIAGGESGGICSEEVPVYRESKTG